mmetsp:Transcript_27604/g.52552  ORF Transcript_27604/g.52552 Transcript_27604/m.52552 type:complete len:117 (+) Transcript_27604:1225-1575(+)
MDCCQVQLGMAPEPKPSPPAVDAMARARVGCGPLLAEKVEAERVARKEGRAKQAEAGETQVLSKGELAETTKRRAGALDVRRAAGMHWLPRAAVLSISEARRCRRSLQCLAQRKPL